MQVINVNDVTVVNENNIRIRNISFSIEMGSFVSIIGKNGSGKSSLIKLMSGILNYNGYININGYYLDDVGIKDIRRITSVVFDNMDEEILENIVRDNLVMSLVNMGKSDTYINKRLIEICSLFDFDRSILNKKMILLDNDLRQKVLIASAVISKPSILFLDDCLSLLSKKDKNNVLGILKKLCLNEKMTILMTTNDMEDVLKTDEVIVMDNGEIVIQGRVKNVFKDVNKIKKYNIDLPFVASLSMKLIDKGIIDNIYLDEKKLVGALWK